MRKHIISASELYKYFAKNNWRGCLDLSVSFLLYVMMFSALYVSQYYSVWVRPVCVVMLAFSIVRLFVLQHDCGHGSLFTKAQYNKMVGRFLSVFTFVPFLSWQWQHFIHHATSGKIDHRGIGDIDFFTVDEYETLPRIKKIAYVIYRHPLVLFFFIAPFYFLIYLRMIPSYCKKHPTYKPAIWWSAQLSNISLVLFYTLLTALMGKFMLSYFLPAVICGSIIGTWLFYIQHNFPDSYFVPEKDWNYEMAALKGSSFYHLPKIIEWLTAYIGYHHVHHLCSRIPNYRLKACHLENEIFSQSPSFGFIESLSLIKLRLYDPVAMRFLSFKEYSLKVLYEKSRSVRLKGGSKLKARSKTHV